ncbi:sigma-54-dependent Fis family transcriptional regulator [Desulforamulus hydrothermalis]|uniref:Putative DNA-binding transcriptional regulator n=1 Tax=Desulforamulus hydrothermalis Lam5 = DSM 18033 TaxID=1121428 RepID=K8E7D3_9FIRM|nr:sigma 54-interacting transcriptional regulator [Desulforamulus hydrothermalis]CCO07393.1 putative DNA-binding transcriptional regulator [Desulforamulus hydrothermalis Lam5 = DSM 18033]SHH41298.1 PAS domain S-box-containing protein [Desulforamulus hydrothermalis Lam5 = DSM 18033]
MSRLWPIAAKAQQIAETISVVLGVETEIVDNEFTIVAGTGKYRRLVGTKDYEARYHNSQYLYARVLKTGETFVIEDAACDLYGPRDLGEIGEICCAIRLREEIIGVLALVAFDDLQRSRLLTHREDLQEFLQNMASLLASHVAEVEAYNRINIESKRLEVIIESISQGIIAVDQNGLITHCNQEAEKLTRRPKDKLIGFSVLDIWPHSPLADVIKTGQGYKDKEEFYHHNNSKIHLLVSATPVLLNNRALGAVALFRDLDEARKSAYAIASTERNLEINQIKGASSKINDLKNQALRVAQSNSTVLIIGESGTGKELFARAIHYASPRQDKPLVIVNCGAIPETLLESELFGYEEGAFTGARKGGRPGKFELADGGTIFLDEIGDLPLHLQVKLLHVLQRKQVERVGGNKVIPVDVRVIAATNRNLEAMCAKGEFREDLYYRLSVIPFSVPPLRERREDIEILMDHFLQKYRHLMGKQIRGFSEDIRKAFLAYHWPGNIRELENAVEYAVNMEPSEYICLDSIPAKIRSFWLRRDHTKQINLEEQIKHYEKQLLLGYLKQVKDGKLNFTDLPAALGISRATLYRKLKQHRLYDK